MPPHLAMFKQPMPGETFEDSRADYQGDYVVHNQLNDRFYPRNARPVGSAEAASQAGLARPVVYRPPALASLARPVGSAAASSSTAELEIAEPLTELSPSASPPAIRRRKLTESATFQDQRKVARRASALKLDEIAQPCRQA